VTDKEILNQIQSFVESSYLELSKLELQENRSDYNSIFIKSSTTPYRNGTNGNKSVLLCRIKNTGNVRYIAFDSKYRADFEELGLNVTSIKSETDYIRLNIDEFLNTLPKGQKLLNKIFADSFSFASFGCCSKYKECSKAEKCVHEDLLYATACMYRKNLENGDIFY